MANNYQQFSEKIDSLTPPEREWAEQVLDALQEPAQLREAGIRIRTIDPDDWPGFEFEFRSGDRDAESSLWLHADECGNVSHAGEFVRAFLARFRPSACWSLTWSETSSAMRVGEFGGGGLFVTSKSIQVCRAADFVERRSKAFERRAQRRSGR